MHTALDSLNELELGRCVYGNRDLLAEVHELVVGLGGRVVQGRRRFVGRSARPVAYLITEEFPAAVAQLIQGEDTGFLRRLDTPALRTALGLDLDQFENVHTYTLITAHEVLVAYCAEEPTVREDGDPPHGFL